MNQHQQIYQAAVAAKSASSLEEFIEQAQTVVFYFLNVASLPELEQRLHQVDLEVNLQNSQGWIDLISGLWSVVSRGHSSRHAVERLVERMQNEKWWNCHETAQIIEQKLSAIIVF